MRVLWGVHLWSVPYGARYGVYLTVLSGRSSDERLCELVRLQRACRRRPSVVYELHAYQCGSFNEAMAMLGISLTETGVWGQMC